MMWCGRCGIVGISWCNPHLDDAFFAPQMGTPRRGGSFGLSVRLFRREPCSRLKVTVTSTASGDRTQVRR